MKKIGWACSIGWNNNYNAAHDGRGNIWNFGTKAKAEAFGRREVKAGRAHHFFAYEMFSSEAR